MFNKVIDAPMEFFDGCSNGAIVSRISNDGRSVSEFITNFFCCCGEKYSVNNHDHHWNANVI